MEDKINEQLPEKLKVLHFIRDCERAFNHIPNVKVRLQGATYKSTYELASEAHDLIKTLEDGE